MNEEQAEAVVRLQNNSDFLKIQEALSAYRFTLLNHVMAAPDGFTQNRSAGMAFAITKVLGGLGDAADTLNKYRSRS